jgi:type II secretory pathway pseudopilin PulG
MIEILVTLALFAVLGVATIPYAADSYRHYVLTVEAKNVISVMRKAQNMAMANTSESGYGVKFGSNNVILFRGSTYAGRAAAYDETYPISAVVTVTAPAELDFARFSGKLAAGAATIQLTTTEKTKTITVGSEGAIDW